MVRQPVDEFGPTLRRALKCLVTAPAVDQGMVARAQHVGHGELTPDLWPRVAGTLEQAVRERILLSGDRVAQHAGQKPDDCLDHHQHRRFAPDEYVVPDGHLVDWHAAGGGADYPPGDPLLRTPN